MLETNKKIFDWTKKFSAEDIFVKYLRMFRKKGSLRKEDSEILFVTKTTACQFHKAQMFVFFRRP